MEKGAPDCSCRVGVTRACTPSPSPPILAFSNYIFLALCLHYPSQFDASSSMLFNYFYLSLLAAGTALLETGHASTLTPPVIPLTVRTPYLSTWLGDARISPWNKWPMFWTGEEVRCNAVKSKESGTDAMVSTRLVSGF